MPPMRKISIMQLLHRSGQNESVFTKSMFFFLWCTIRIVLLVDSTKRGFIEVMIQLMVKCANWNCQGK